MKSDSARLAFDRPVPARTERTVTLLGATGSIGTSTIDLLKRERKRFRVEAVSANTNAAALAALARELGARFAVVGDADCYRELKSALSGSGIAAAAGESGLIEAAERPAEWVIGGHHRGRWPQADAGGRRPRRNRRARQQGNAGLRRGAVHAPRRCRRRDRAAGRFRTQRAISGHERQPARGRAPRDSHRLRRSVPHRECRRGKDRDRRTGAQAPELVDGSESDDRLGNLDEQGA